MTSEFKDLMSSFQDSPDQLCAVLDLKDESLIAVFTAYTKAGCSTIIVKLNHF